MSDPKRYDLRCRNCGLCDMEEWDDGEFVLWSDYEKLKAENARIRKLFADTERLMLLDGEYEAAKVGTYAVLQAEVDRLTQEYSDATNHYNKLHNDLRKAGDDLDHFLGVLGCTNDKGVRLAWKAAKGVKS